MTNGNQITVYSALLDYYNSQCTNHALYILTVALAFAGILTTNPQRIILSLLLGIFIPTEIYLGLQLLLWALLTNEIMKERNTTLEDFASLHREFAKGVKERAIKDRDRIPRIVIGFKNLCSWQQLTLLFIIGVVSGVAVFLIREFVMKS